ncbi:hypothetical protein [Rahnella aquatilis]|uniref:hypothetical protein n=1 Tax=Rahnella aquatilis TaxID=34038 RepID=UPI000649025B|nr:hypothetical protein [Rahnella aquatilis]
MSYTPPFRNNRTRWTLNDLNFLENNYATMPVTEISAKLGRTPGAVALMADKLGCRRKKNAPWSEPEKEIIRTHYTKGIEAGALTQLLPGRSINAIFSKAETMGVLSGRFWREEELDILKEDYPRVGTAVTDRLPGRNAISVRMMAKRLGLKKSRNSNVGFRLWSDEEWALLEKNRHLSVAEQQATLFPDRTTKAVEKARGRLIKNRVKTPKDLR